jgi:hypothetical protein
MISARVSGRDLHSDIIGSCSKVYFARLFVNFIVPLPASDFALRATTRRVAGTESADKVIFYIPLIGPETKARHHSVILDASLSQGCIYKSYLSARFCPKGCCFSLSGILAESEKKDSLSAYSAALR